MMKLSEAIRLGALLKPQKHGTDLTNATSCALEAACEAVGLPMRAWSDYRMVQLFPIMKQPVLNPDNQLEQILEEIIWYLNDCCKWTRERIADWVATVEPQDDPISEPLALEEPSHAHPTT